MNRIKICNFICVALALVLLILHFSPFWEYDGMQASIQGYIWFPKDYPELEAWFTETLNAAFYINDVIGIPIFLLVSAVASVFFCIWKCELPLMAILPGACGIAGIIGYLMNPILRLGTNRWLHVVVCVLMVITAVTTFVLPLRDIIVQWYRERKKK